MLENNRPSRLAALATLPPCSHRTWPKLQVITCHALPCMLDSNNRPPEDKHYSTCTIPAAIITGHDFQVTRTETEVHFVTVHACLAVHGADGPERSL